MARYRLFDLATEHIQRIEKGNISQDERNSCLYARAFIEKVGGDYDTTPEGRLSLLKAAIQHYTEFLGKIGADHKSADDARSEAASCQRALGAQLKELADAGTDPAANREAAVAAFRSAVKQLNELHNSRLKAVAAMPDEESSDAGDEAEGDAPTRTAKDEARIDAFESVYELAATYYEWAQLYPENDLERQGYLKKALEQTTTYTWELGAETIRSYDVNFIAGVANVGLNQLEDGLAMLEYNISDETGVPSVIAANEDLPAAVVGELTAMVEKTFLELARIYNRQSKFAETDKLEKRVDEFYKKFSARGAKRTSVGEMLLLEVGLARCQSGSAGGMKLLEDIAKRNQGNSVGQRAGELMAKVIRDAAVGGAGGAAKIPPSTWISAADASRNQNKLLDAIEAYHNALGAIDLVTDPKERGLVSVTCWSDIGSCYRGLSRNVEAAIAYQQGLAAASGVKDLDEELVQKVGISWYQALVSRFKETKTDADKKAKDGALRRLASDYKVRNTEYLVAVDEFNQAKVLPADKKEERAKAFAEVAQKLGAIKDDDANYDRARVLLARCHGEQGDLDPKKLEVALHTLDAFDKYAASHEPPADKQRLINRDVSRTESVYYRSEYLAELKRHDAVLDVLKSFEKDFPKQVDFFPEVNYRKLIALLELKRFPEAEAHYFATTKRIEANELKPWRDTAGYYLAKGYLEAGPAESDAAKKASLLAKGAELMMAYCRATGYSSYINLLVVCETWAGLKEWPKAEEAYKKLIDVFGKEAQYKENIELRIRKTLAEVLVEQKKFTDAAPLYRDLAPRFGKDPSYVRAAALCYGGWVEIVDKKAVEVPGAGDYARAVEQWDMLLTLWLKDEKKFTTPWFEAKFLSIYCRYRAKDADPAFMTQAVKVMESFKTAVWDFKKDEPDFVTTLGGPDWKRRWEYLFERVR
jgi:tetratricopeptide (TPR) repeat protein